MHLFSLSLQIELEFKVKSQQKLIASKDADINDLTARKAAVDKQRRRIEEERDKLFQQNSDLQRAKAELTGELIQYNDFKHKMEKMEERSALLEGDLKAAQSENDALKKNKILMSERIDELQGEVDRLRGEVWLTVWVIN